MKVFSAKQAKDGFGRLIDTAQKEPVQIEKKGRAVAVLVSSDEYARLEAMENVWWAEQAKTAAKEGHLGNAESEKLLASLLNAQD